MLGNLLFGAERLTKDIDFDKYKYTGYVIEFNIPKSFLSCGSSEFNKNFITFGENVSS